MAEPTYLDARRICFGDVEIKLLEGDSTEVYSKNPDGYYMIKSLPYIDSYRCIRDAMATGPWAGPARNVLEVGVGFGGSAPFLHKFFDAERLVCLDIVAGVPALDRYRTGSGDVLRVHYNIDQGRKDVVQGIVRRDFSSPIDLVIDDASHHYRPSKATFEAVFPYVRPGGVYVVEDWTWSHGEDAQLPGHHWADLESLTNLVIELVIVAGGGSGLIASIGFGNGLMWVVKGWKAASVEGFALADHLNLRGRELSTI